MHMCVYIQYMRASVCVRVCISTAMACASMRAGRRIRLSVRHTRKRVRREALEIVVCLLMCGKARKSRFDVN
jgi:hypothetical protein